MKNNGLDRCLKSEAIHKMIRRIREKLQILLMHN